MRRTLCVAFVSLLLTVGCAPAPAPEPEAPAIDLNAERAALMQADRDWYAAYAASDDPVGVFVSAMTDDANLLPPGAPLATGKEAIGAVIAQLEGMPGFSVQWSPTLAEVGGGADLGYTMGTYEMRFDGPDGQPVTINGKYITVWRKQADGSWKVSADMFNADAPPAPAEGEGS